MIVTLEPQLKRGQVAFPCTCCGSPVERENVYCPLCLQAIRASASHGKFVFFLRWADSAIRRAA